MPNDFNTPVQRELDWNDTIENEDRPFVILPEGNYPFRVISIEKARHTPGPQGKLPPCNKAVLTVRLTAPDGATADVKHHLFLHSSQEWKLCEFFTAIGARRKGEPLRMNWNAVPGAMGVCQVRIRQYVRRDGDQGQRNEIVRFYEPMEQGGFMPEPF